MTSARLTFSLNLTLSHRFLCMSTGVKCMKTDRDHQLRNRGWRPVLAQDFDQKQPISYERRLWVGVAHSTSAYGFPKSSWSGKIAVSDTIVAFLLVGCTGVAMSWVYVRELWLISQSFQNEPEMIEEYCPQSCSFCLEWYSNLCNLLLQRLSIVLDWIVNWSLCRGIVYG